VFNRVKQLKQTQYLSVVLIFLLLLVATPVAAQSIGVGDGSYSGDDAYDPAVGGLPAISVAAAPRQIARSGATTLSGDDAYDPAAGGLPALSVAAVPRQSVQSGATTLSGDDAYDPAAGGLPAVIRSAGSEVACAPSAGELEARRTRSVDGGFSGDDAYDPAAGGTPELSLLAIGLDLVTCAPTVSGN
jgi:hypothetical protein